MSEKRVAIVGAGILGLAHAWAAARAGHKVTVFEKTAKATGASVRNFGMIWPIGQPSGEALAVALESRSLWLEFAQKANHWALPCGSLHAAHRQDEWRVLEEFAAQARGFGYDCQLLNREQTRKQAPGVNPEGLLGGLFSSTEVAVDPRKASAALARWLAETFAVSFCFSAEVAAIESSGSDPRIRLRGAEGNGSSFDRIVVCAGSEYQALFPESFQSSGIRLCKLQMMRTVAQLGGWRIGPHLASGLTLRHYQNFSVCSGIGALKERIARETPELDRYGIHVMASQNAEGEVILGDSHEYDREIEPFDKTLIDELMVRELRKVFAFPDWTIAERWHGIYAKPASGFIVEAEPLPGVHVCAAAGGSGMTMSQGIAARFWRNLDR